MWTFDRFTPFIGCEAALAEAETVLFGAPFDGTTSYRPGARFGPAAMRNESFGIETYSPALDRDLTDYPIADLGDLDLPFGNTARVLELIEQQTADLLAAGKRPVLLGGEHLVTLGALRAMVKQYPDLCILHFDAHADLRDDYLGESLSHATVMRRAYDLTGEGRLYQFGIRSGERAEFQFAAAQTHMEKFTADRVADAVAAIAGRPVYLTVDLDVLDSTLLPGTGTPEAGGLGFSVLMSALYTAAGCRIVGADVVELAPCYDVGGASTMVACKLLRELLLCLQSPNL